MKTTQLVLGTLAVGTIAYLLLSKKDPPPPGQAVGPAGVPGGAPGGSLPLPGGGSIPIPNFPSFPNLPGIPGVPGVPGAPAGSPSMLGNPLHLKQGQYYRGRLTMRELDLPPFNTLASADVLAKGVSALGFTDVHVYMGVGDLPSDWPQITAVGATSTTRFFSGQWNGPTGDIPRPWQIEMMWPTSSPGLVASRARGA